MAQMVRGRVLMQHVMTYRVMARMMRCRVVVRRVMMHHRLVMYRMMVSMVRQSRVISFRGKL